MKTRFDAIVRFICILFLPVSLLAQVFASGKVLNEKSNPIKDAKVIVLETQKAYYADDEGSFGFDLPKPGFFTFRILVDEEVFQQRHEVQYSGQIVRMNIIRSSGGIDEEGIYVIGRKDKTKLSRYRLNNDEIKRLPGVYGDSLKAVGTLPGISPAAPIGVMPSVNLLSSSFLAGFGVGPPYANSTSGVMVIRGSGSRASTFYFDGFIMQYPFHLGDQSSVLNNDIIRTIDVYTGTFPVRFGNTTGGVISVEGPQNVEKPKGHVNLALFLADSYYETPLFGGLGYAVATARQSYPNFALLQLYPDAIPANAKYANYTDGQFKLAIKPTQKQEIVFLYLGARDILQYTKTVSEATNKRYRDQSLLSSLGLNFDGSGSNTNSDSRPPVGLDRGFHTQGAKHTIVVGGFLRNTLITQISRFREDFELDFRSPATGETIFGFEVLNARQEFQVKDELAAEIWKDTVTVSVGVESTKYRWELSAENFSPSSSINPNTPNFVDTINQLVDSNRTFRALYDGDRTRFSLNAAFSELEIEFWRLRLTPGIRVDEFTLSDSVGIGPRMGAEFKISETGTTLLAGAGRHFNVPPSLETISIEAGNPFLEMEESDHAAVGIQQNLGKEWFIQVEGFHNTFTNIVVEDQFVFQPYSLRTNRRDLIEIPQQVLSDPFESRPLRYSNDGTGDSTGVEFLFKKTRTPGRNGWFGWLSYSNSISKRNNHQPRMSREDKQTPILTNLTTTPKILLDDQASLNNRNIGRKPVAYFDVGKHPAIYYDSGEFELYPDNDKEELYDLDRTHQVSLVFNYKFNPKWQLGGRWRYSSNTPFTPIVGNETLPTQAILGRSTFLPKYSSQFNSDRLSPVHQLDIRVDHFSNYSWGFVNTYLELINFYGRKNAESQNFNFLYPFNRGSNPETVYESTYIETPIGNGRKRLLPLINIGVEVQF